MKKGQPELRMTLRALAALLSYPSAELAANIGAVRQALHAEAALPAAALAALEPLLTKLERDELLDLQADYSELFDRSRKYSLHLFEHVHGDNRERGQAIIDLGQEYVDRGFYLDAAELPDFIPVFFEFLSCQPPAEAREWLEQPAHVFAALKERLAASGSPYAAVLAAAVALPGRRPDQEAVAALQEQARADDGKSIDELWEEAPVTFTTPAAPASHAAGVVDRIRAAQQSLIASQK